MHVENWAKMPEDAGGVDQRCCHRQGRKSIGSGTLWRKNIALIHSPVLILTLREVGASLVRADPVATRHQVDPTATWDRRMQLHTRSGVPTATAALMLHTGTPGLHVHPDGSCPHTRHTGGQRPNTLAAKALPRTRMATSMSRGTRIGRHGHNALVLKFEGRQVCHELSKRGAMYEDMDQPHARHRLRVASTSESRQRSHLIFDSGQPARHW